VEILAYAVVAVVAYLIGSVPTGYLAARAKGIDIRTVGSGNIGATNAFRILGTVPGALVLVADALKGSVAVVFLGLAGPLVAQTPAGQVDQAAAQFQVAAGIAAILGHSYTCWLGFKGGKGVATTAGVFLTLMPWALLAALGVWLVGLLVSRYVSVASILAAVALPVATWTLPLPAWQRDNRMMLFWVALALGSLVIYRHRGNIRRLLDGTESRLGTKKPAAEKGGAV